MKIRHRKPSPNPLTNGTNLSCRHRLTRSCTGHFVHEPGLPVRFTDRASAEIDGCLFMDWKPSNLGFAVVGEGPACRCQKVLGIVITAGSAWLHDVRNFEGSKNKQLFFRLPVQRRSSCGLLSVAPLAASRCSKIPARSGTSMLWISVACRLRSSVTASCHETGSSAGQRPFVSKGRKRVSIPPVMRQVGSNLRQNSCPLRSSRRRPPPWKGLTRRGKSRAVEVCISWAAW